MLDGDVLEEQPTTAAPPGDDDIDYMGTCQPGQYLSEIVYTDPRKRDEGYEKKEIANDWCATLFEYTEGVVELRAFPNERGKGKPANVFIKNPRKIKAFIDRFDIAGYGCYFGVATRDPESDPPGTIVTTAELPALWMDSDNTPKDRMKAALLGCYLPPSIIVDSGRGLHGYWLLDEPLDVREATSNDHPAVEALRGLRRVFDGDPAVCDLARVMRLPGTHNTKYGTMHKVEVIHQSDRRYTFYDIVEWLGWQREIIGEQTDPFAAAAEKLGVRPRVKLEDMQLGNIHDIQLRWSASMVSAGVAEDEIVEALLTATRAAAGKEGVRWNWRQEEDAIREMIRTGKPKFADGKVVSLQEKRQKRAGVSITSVPLSEVADEHIIVKVATCALEVWNRPIITVKGELWTYEGGIWHQFESEWEHSLRVCIQGAVGALKAAPLSNTLNGAYRWILERPAFVRRGIEWDRAGVIVGENGALDLLTSKIKPHSQEHYATRRVACTIDPDAKCPTWLTFLEEAMPADAAGTVQEWIGASLMRGKTREMTKGMLVYGPSRTGKTQLTEVMRALLGGNTCGVRVKDLGERFGREPLITCSGWIADDAVGKREEMDAEAYKIIVTGESTSVQRKGKVNAEVAFDIPVLLTMNNYPIVKDDSEAVYNRSLVLPMTRQWSEEEAKPIARQVVADELSGVLNWALTGWNRLRERGRFYPPEVMLTAGKDFRSQNNPMDEFLELFVETNPYYYVMRNDFLRIFNNWVELELQLRKGWSGKAVGTALVKNTRAKAHGDKVGAGRVWVGICFVEAALAFDVNDWSLAHTRDLNPEEVTKKLAKLNRELTDELRKKYPPPIKTPPLF
jgi:P4 family phage/plasmid primase-like protien